MKQFIRFAALTVTAGALTGCGLFSSPHSSRTVRRVSATTRRIDVPVIKWHPVSVGGQGLLKEDTSISSVLPGPSGRIYYGTSNPLGDSNVIGWYNPENGHNGWTHVPRMPDFPRQSVFQTNDLTLSESAYWGAVDLIVSGADTVWYRHWGYVGGLTGSGRFVPGDYAIPGPTVHKNFSTVSVHTSFDGTPQVQVMNTQTKQMQSYPMPSRSSPVAISFGQNVQHIWLLDPNTLWELDAKTRQWTPFATSALGDFFVSMGQFHSSLWILDANGNIGAIRNGHLRWVGHVPTHPITAETAGHNGLWLVSRHHLMLWFAHQPVRKWQWPRLSYPTSATQWSTPGSPTPSDWPPLPHILRGPHDVLDIGYGTFIGQAYFVMKTVSAAPRSSSQK
ncbi:MAG: hypothetical protein M1294_07600 [Firmicutes bacterium]|nr:hypothetical protein [Bacillota bacterium]MCL5014625.1 hypothetical protein [Bacillota bacterium]